jgi:protein involved in polysaccharide export with SLBB domain
MRLKQWLSAIPALVVGLALLPGCVTDDSKPKPLPPVNCSADEIRPGDGLTFTFADANPPPIQGLEHRDRVKDDGNIQLPLIGSIKVVGRHSGDVEREIQRLYIDKGYYRRITVTIRVEERYYSVGGEVRNPGPKNYVGEVSVLRAIQSAGDFTDFADKTSVKVIRATGSNEVFNANKALKDPAHFDRKICPGDTIHVGRRVF